MAAVTVILPVYNGAAFLERSIASLQAQTCNDWQLIIVDDGSTDDSRSIAAAAAAADGRVRLVCRPNGGVSSARNAGIGLAQTEYIAFLDADDEYYPDALAAMLARAHATGADMVCANMVEGEERPDSVPAPAWTTVGGHVAALATLYQQKPWHTGPCSKLYRRSLFDEVRFREGMRYEDLEIMPYLLERCRKVDVTAAPLYFYRRNPSSFMQTWSDGRLDALTVTESIEKHYLAEASQSSFSAAMAKAAKARHFSALCNIAGLASAARQHETARRCLDKIRALRSDMLRDDRVRRRNKAAALISALPAPVALWLLRLAVR